MKIDINKGTFADKALEADFLEHERENILRYMRPLVLASGLLFFFFAVPDYFLNPSPEVFRVILAVRTLFLMLVLLFFLALGSRQVQLKLHNWVSIYALIVTVAYLVIYYYYETTVAYSPFFVQSFAVIVFILIFFSIDSHWVHMLVISTLLAAGFIVISVLRDEDISSTGLAGVIVYIMLVIIISSLAALRINIYKRLQFIDRRKLKELSEKDALTGIYNRGKFDQELSRAINMAERYEYIFSLIMIDLDNLKTVNDQMGHQAGDKILKEFAGLVRSQLRASDLFARWGGDEFIVLLPYTDSEQAIAMAERISNTVESYNSAVVDKMSCSFGIAVYKENDDPNTIVQRADNMLYEAKSKKKI